MADESKRSRWRKFAIVTGTIVLSMVLYFGSYLLLGRHATGFSYHNSGRDAKKFYYHDRYFPFDPWIFKPAAMLEYRLRGERSQIVVRDGRYRGGEPTYGYGPFE